MSPCRDTTVFHPTSHVRRIVGIAFSVFLLVPLVPRSSVAQAGAPRAGSRTDTAVTAFVDVHVVRPGPESRVDRHRTVVVKGETIAAVGRAGELDVPPGARRIAGGGERYLSPGLTDAHVHLRAEPSGWLDLFLVNGVTTVLNLRGDAADLELRRRVVQGEISGPTIYSAGDYLDERAYATPDAAASTLRELVRDGYDMAKIHGPMPSRAFRWISEAARDQGVPVVGHVPRNLPLDTALTAGMVMVSHAEELVYAGLEDLDPADLSPLAARMAEGRVWLVPTLAGFATLAGQWGDSSAVAARLDRPEARYLDPRIRAFWTGGNPYVRRARTRAREERFAEQLRFQERMVRVFQEAGVGLLAGTDAPFPTMFPGFSLHEELAALHGAGLGLGETLGTATVNPGRFVRTRIRPDERFGRVESGYRADLLLLEANPLVDLSVLENPLGVMVRGRWLDRQELRRRSAAVEARVEEARAESSGPATEDELSSFTGRFVSDAPAFDVRVILGRDGLSVVDAVARDEKPRYALAPVEPSVFEVRGGPFPMFAVFGEEGDVMTLRRRAPDGEVFATLRRTGRVSRTDDPGAEPTPEPRDESVRPGSAVDTTRLADVVRETRSRMRALSRRGAGIQAAIVADGRVAWTGAFGPADVEANRAATEATRFRIYSLSKPMTAVAAVRLAGQGTLDLSAPVQTYVPSFPQKQGVVTPMHLIRHTSGIRHYRDDEEARSQRHCDTVDEALEIFSDDPLVHLPGAEETYSTWGFVLLSAVLEGAAGTRYADVMRRAVFEPAGMENTMLGGSGSPRRGGGIEDLARFYRLDPDGGRVSAREADVSCKWGGGAWLSTAGDLGRFFGAVLDGTLLPPETARSLTGGASVYEGMGVGPGGLALARADLERGVALVVLTNAPGERFGPELRAAADTLFDRLREAAGPSPGQPPSADVVSVPLRCPPVAVPLREAPRLPVSACVGSPPEPAALSVGVGLRAALPGVRRTPCTEGSSTKGRYSPRLSVMESPSATSRSSSDTCSRNVASMEPRSDSTVRRRRSSSSDFWSTRPRTS